MVSVNGSTDDCGVRRAGCRGGRRVERAHRPAARKPVATRPARIVVSCERTRPAKKSLAADWLAGVAMLCAAASWGVLAALLGG